jgi:hypothetical protein
VLAAPLVGCSSGLIVVRQLRDYFSDSLMMSEILCCLGFELASRRTLISMFPSTNRASFPSVPIA